MKKYINDIAIAIESIIANKVKSILTALGIIFGVAAVISMLAIGNGAQQEILEQMKMVGVNNIIIQPIVETQETNAEESVETKDKYSPGLTLKDLNAIVSEIPVINKVSPQITKDTYVVQSGIRRSAKLHGVEPEFFELFNIQLLEGKMFTQNHLKKGLPCCIVSEDIAIRFFSSIKVVGKKIKCGREWLTIQGVAEKRSVGESTGKLGLSSGQDVIYIPVQTMLIRFENRAAITAADLIKKDEDDEENTQKTIQRSYHQLDKIIVQVQETEQLTGVADIIKRILIRKHLNVEDFDVIVPELLLKQQQRTKDIFKWVLGAIAGIALLVGGIGIMNIMLASVLERIKEIGTRKALGATRKNIEVQFMAESTIISITGGLIGILLGFVLSILVSRFADILTIVSAGSVFISFTISVGIGIIFGYMPAKKAAQQDPVVSLRSE
ncbi:MAG: ABC transporter permease [Salinivirgaceae bacterium]|nr:ABC transporter permease [Salinivirgaceae bacterium]